MPIVTFVVLIPPDIPIPFSSLTDFDWWLNLRTLITLDSVSSELKVSHNHSTRIIDTKY